MEETKEEITETRHDNDSGEVAIDGIEPIEETPNVNERMVELFNNLAFLSGGDNNIEESKDEITDIRVGDSGTLSGDKNMEEDFNEVLAIDPATSGGDDARLQAAINDPDIRDGYLATYSGNRFPRGVETDLETAVRVWHQGLSNSSIPAIPNPKANRHFSKVRVMLRDLISILFTPGAASFTSRTFQLTNSLAKMRERMQEIAGDLPGDVKQILDVLVGYVHRTKERWETYPNPIPSNGNCVYMGVFQNHTPGGKTKNYVKFGETSRGFKRIGEQKGLAAAGLLYGEEQLEFLIPEPIVDALVDITLEQGMSVLQMLNFDKSKLDALRSKLLRHLGEFVAACGSHHGKGTRYLEAIRASTEGGEFPNAKKLLDAFEAVQAAFEKGDIPSDFFKPGDWFHCLFTWPTLAYAIKLLRERRYSAYEKGMPNDKDPQNFLKRIMNDFAFLHRMTWEDAMEKSPHQIEVDKMLGKLIPLLQLTEAQVKERGGFEEVSKEVKGLLDALCGYYEYPKPEDLGLQTKNKLDALLSSESELEDNKIIVVEATAKDAITKVPGAERYWDDTFNLVCEHEGIFLFKTKGEENPRRILVGPSLHVPFSPNISIQARINVLIKMVVMLEMCWQGKCYTNEDERKQNQLEEEKDDIVKRWLSAVMLFEGIGKKGDEQEQEKDEEEDEEGGEQQNSWMRAQRQVLPEWMIGKGPKPGIKLMSKTLGCSYHTLLYIMLFLENLEPALVRRWFDFVGLPTVKTPLEEDWECPGLPEHISYTGEVLPKLSCHNVDAANASSYSFVQQGNTFHFVCSSCNSTYHTRKSRHNPPQQQQDNTTERVTRRSQNEEAVWQESYHALVAYKEKHRDCLVPTTNHELSKFVKRQRDEYKRFHKVASVKITQERIDLLNAIGFVWDAHEAAWQKNMKMLRKYCDDNGHCFVPVKDPSLGKFVSLARASYNASLAGKKHTTVLTQERIKELNDLNFVWDASQAKWGENYNNIMTFYEEKRRFPINIFGESKMDNWLRAEKREHTRLKRGEGEEKRQKDWRTRDLTEEETAKLEVLLSLYWDWMYGQLKDHYDEHQNVNVNGRDNQRLYNWRNEQKEAYAFQQEHQIQMLTPEQVEKLQYVKLLV